MKVGRTPLLADRLDRLALFVVQPVMAVLSAVGLLSHSETATEITRPIFIWGSVSLLVVIIAEGVWSFAARHRQGQRLVMLWSKMIGAGLCAILAFASAYKHLGLLDNGVLSHDGFTAMYFSVATWATAGLGDVSASAAARPFVAAQAIIGLGYNSALIGLILYALTRPQRHVGD